MKLGDHVEMVLATCLSNDDPEKLGRIKVGAPGYFDRTVMAIEAIPWAYPLRMSHYQSYSTIAEGGKVWLIDNKDNADEFWYIPYHELNNDTKQAINDDVASDVLFSRSTNGRLIQLYQNNSEGIVLRVGDSTVKITSRGAIQAEADGASIVIEGKTVYAGKTGGDKVPMVMGDACRDIMKTLSSDLKNVWSLASENPYTAHLAEPLQQCWSNITSKLADLTSDTCTLSK